MYRFGVLCWLACGFGGSLLLAAPVPQGTDAKSPAALAKEIEQLIRQLGGDSFDGREEAQQKLSKLGSAAEAQLQAARKSTDPEVARRAGIVLDTLRKQHVGNAEVHVIGLYEARDRKVIVEVHETTKPIILVLCAYERVVWSVQAKGKAQVLQVIAAGYHAQQVEDTTAPVATYSYDERSVGPDGRPLYFFTFDHDEERYPDMVAKVGQLTGKKASSFQGRYSFRKVPFVIGGKE